MFDVRIVHDLIYKRREQGAPCCGDSGGRRWSKKTVRLSDQIRNEFQSLAQGTASCARFALESSKYPCLDSCQLRAVLRIQRERVPTPPRRSPK
jgi:hypothetical protein